MPVLHCFDQIMRCSVYPLVGEDDILLATVRDLKKILDVGGIRLPVA